MAVYYKFKSAKDFDIVPIDGHFVSVAILKEKIFESKHLGRGTDFDLVVTNTQTGEEYLDEELLIPKNTSVLICRVPGRPRMSIVTQQQPKVEIKVDDHAPPNGSFTGADSSATKYPDDTDWDEFGNDLYAIPEMTPVQFTNSVQDAPPPTKEDEDSKIQALIETPALDWQQQPLDGYGAGRGFGRGGRMIGGRGFSGTGSDRRAPPQGYVCHRCKVPGHYIQHCPTNGDPNYDVKKMRPPTGIPKSMLIETPDGFYALPSGSVAVLKPNEAAFEKEIEGLPTARSVGEISTEYRCPLCREIMKDAVITIKCCFTTFCDRCVRDHIISMSACVCGQKDVLTDDLIPNKVVRDSINRFLECNNNGSAENPGSNYQVQDLGNARHPSARVPSPTFSAASNGEQAPALEDNVNHRPAENQEQGASAPQPTLENGSTSKVATVSEVTHDSASAKEPASQMSAPHAEEEVQQKATAKTGKKIKKKKICAPANAAEMQWNIGQEFGAENYMMPMGPAGFNPYWSGMQPGMEAYMPPYPMPFMGAYPLGPVDMAYGGFMPHDPFAPQGFLCPPVLPQHPYQRDVTDFGMGYNGGTPRAMNKEEFEARKTDLRRKREMEESRAGSMRGGDLPPRNREPSKDTAAKSIAAKPKSRLAEENHRHGSALSSGTRSPPRRASSTHSARQSPPHPSKRKSSVQDYDDDRRDHHSSIARAKLESSSAKAGTSAATSEGKSKASVFARISFPDRECGVSKKKKISSSSTASVQDGGAMSCNDGSKRKSEYYAESSDEDDRHFKRKKRSRYEEAPTDYPDKGHSRNRHRR